MRRLFIVFGKLLGLLMLYWGLSWLGWVSMLVRRLLSGGEGPSTSYWMLYGYGAYFLLSLSLAVLLMFKTEKVADWLRLKKDEEIGKAPSIHQMLMTGSALIGIYVLVFTIPSLVSTLLQIREYPRHWDSSSFVRQVIPYVLQLVLGLFLVLRAKAVARWIERRTEQTEPAPGSDETPTRPAPGE